jgi:hypothetical protein
LLAVGLAIPIAALLATWILEFRTLSDVLFVLASSAWVGLPVGLPVALCTTWLLRWDEARPSLLLPRAALTCVVGMAALVFVRQIVPG